MHRHALTDSQWARVLPLLPPGRPGPKAKLGDRHFVDAVLYRAKTGLPWRDLPERFGPWKNVFNRFSRWARAGLWQRRFESLQLQVDPRGCIVDACVVRAHLDACGAKGGGCNAFGRSRGGFSTKVHALVDYKGRPLRLVLTPGQRHEMVAAGELLEAAQGEALLGDTSYDSNDFIQQIEARGMRAVIPPHPGRKQPRPLDETVYRQRYLVELCFHRLKRFRAVATRYDKMARNFLALLHLACAWLWLN